MNPLKKKTPIVYFRKKKKLLKTQDMDACIGETRDANSWNESVRQMLIFRPSPLRNNMGCAYNRLHRKVLWDLDPDYAYPLWFMKL